jgi:hypothetical protein
MKRPELTKAQRRILEVLALERTLSTEPFVAQRCGRQTIIGDMMELGIAGLLEAKRSKIRITPAGLAALSHEEAGR